MCVLHWQPGRRHLGIFSACQGSSRRPGSRTARTPHTAPPSLLPPPVSSLTPVTGSQPLQVVTCHPLSWPRAGHTGQAQHSPASSSQHGTAACCCSLLTASLPPGPLLPPAAGGQAGGGEPPVPLPGGRCTLCTVHPRCRDCALCKIRLSCAVLGWPQWPHRRTPARAAVIIPPTPGPHFYTSQHQHISHSALWHYSTAWSWREMTQSPAQQSECPM